jgi:predicted negative regulator of RcsB-dependent stress response
VDRLTRKELKTDKFALELEHGVEYVTGHQAQVKKYGTIAAAVLVLVFGTYFFRSYQQGAREDALREALKVQDAQVANGSMEGMVFFPTQAEKDAAVQKALTGVATKYSGTSEGSVARYYLGTTAADKGDMAAAEKAFKDVADNGPSDYGSLAKMALAPIYKSQGKTAEGEKLLRDLIANPTIFVSKEEATIALGSYIGSSNPAEVRKLLEPLRTERSSVSRAALSVLGELPQK